MNVAMEKLGLYKTTDVQRYISEERTPFRDELGCKVRRRVCVFMC